MRCGGSKTYSLWSKSAKSIWPLLISLITVNQENIACLIERVLSLNIDVIKLYDRNVKYKVHKNTAHQNS